MKFNLNYDNKVFNYLILNEFIFNIFILIQSFYIIITNIIYLFFVLYFIFNYIVYILYMNILINYNCIIFEIEYIFWEFLKQNLINKKKIITKDFKQTILLIKRVSKTKKKGRIKSFKTVLVIGNNSGWIGIGKGKSKSLQEAIYKTRLSAFKNIFYISEIINIKKKYDKYIILYNKYQKLKYKSNIWTKKFMELAKINNENQKFS